MYLELFVIRWMSGGIRFFTVFRTFPLIVCFVGLGLGCALGKDKFFRFTNLMLLLVAAIVKVSILTGVMRWMFPSFSIYSWQDLEVFGLAKVWLCISLVIAMLSGPFLLMLCVGSRLGKLFDAVAGLKAYSINVSGAIAGSILFALASFWGWPPWLLLIPAVVPIAAYLIKLGSPALALLPAAASLVVAYWPTTGPGVDTIWSPYQQLTVGSFARQYNWKVQDVNGASATQDKSSVDFFAQQALADLIAKCYVIKTNYYIYQSAINTSDSAVQIASMYEPYAELFKREARHYNMPYRLTVPDEMLVVGAGSGNDVAAALRNGVKHVDAVDLDPSIIDLGRRLHPEHPYASPRVTVICDDARDYFNRCRKKYDMIVIAGLDSQTVSGQSSSMRVDTYVHTKESIARACSLLKPDGLLLLTFYDRVPWIAERLYCTIKSAVGYEPLVVHDAAPTYMQNFWETFIMGPPVERGSFTLPADYAPFVARKMDNVRCNRVVTDDWPYLYVMDVPVDWPYWAVMLIVLGVSVMLARRVVVTRNEPAYWQMFFLGAAFLLLELKSVAQLSLVFGATWLTSSVVIDGILVMILVANYIVMRTKTKLIGHQSALYAALALLLLLRYCTPFDWILYHAGLPNWLGQTFVTVLSIMPLFAASIIFALAFANVRQPGRALAFNLLGAVVGGLLEYVSNYTGIRSLVILAAILYAGSYLALRQSAGRQNQEPAAGLDRG